MKFRWPIIPLEIFFSLSLFFFFFFRFIFDFFFFYILFSQFFSCDINPSLLAFFYISCRCGNSFSLFFSFSSVVSNVSLIALYMLTCRIEFSLNAWFVLNSWCRWHTEGYIKFFENSWINCQRISLQKKDKIENARIIFFKYQFDEIEIQFFLNL